MAKKGKNITLDFLSKMEEINRKYEPALKHLAQGPGTRALKSRAFEFERWVGTFIEEDKRILDELAKK